MFLDQNVSNICDAPLCEVVSLSQLPQHLVLSHILAYVFIKTTSVIRVCPTVLTPDSNSCNTPRHEEGEGLVFYSEPTTKTISGQGSQPVNRFDKQRKNRVSRRELNPPTYTQTTISHQSRFRFNYLYYNKLPFNSSTNLIILFLFSRM